MTATSKNAGEFSKMTQNRFVSELKSIQRETFAGEVIERETEQERKRARS